MRILRHLVPMYRPEALLLMGSAFFHGGTRTAQSGRGDEQQERGRDRHGSFFVGTAQDIRAGCPQPPNRVHSLTPLSAQYSHQSMLHAEKIDNFSTIFHTPLDISVDFVYNKK